jgi:hypothetical protein
VNLLSFWSKALICLLLCTGLSAGALSAQPVSAYALNRSTLALGEPLTLRITRALGAASTPLDALDLSALARDFEIQERTAGRDSQQENLTLTLYPRRLGRITMPGLGQPGPLPVVTVTETSDTMPRVRFRITADPAEPLVRQPTTLTLEACDDGTLLWKRPQLPVVEGLLFRPLNETEIITQRDGQRCTAHRWHWSVLPTASGRTPLTLPMLEAGKFGTRLRFEPPAFKLNVLALPGWLPAEAAVGAPDIVAEPLPAQAMIDQPLAWRLRVTGSYSATALKTLLDMQIRNSGDTPELTPYAPRVEPLAGLTLAPQHMVTLYLLPRERGTLTAPDLQLPWYDPQAGRLMHTQVPGAHVEVVDPMRQRWLSGLTAAAALLILAITSIWLWHWQQWRFRRFHVDRMLRRARSTEELNTLLMSFSTATGATPFPTLQIWRRHVDAQFRSTGLSELVDALERSRFGAKQISECPPVSIDELAGKARTWLASLQLRRNVALFKKD